MKTSVVLVALIAVLGHRLVWAANDSAAPAPSSTITNSTISFSSTTTTFIVPFPLPANATTSTNNATPALTSTSTQAPIGSEHSTNAAKHENFMETSTRAGANVVASSLLSVVVGLSTMLYQNSV